MTDPLQTLLASGNRPINHFPVTSRYYRVETGAFEINGVNRVTYLRRRFIPPDDSLSFMVTHPVREGDRLDTIAANYLGDPEQFWQIADANNAIKPEELTDEAGRELKIARSQ